VEGCRWYPAWIASSGFAVFLVIDNRTEKEGNTKSWDELLKGVTEVYEKINGVNVVGLRCT